MNLKRTLIFAALAVLITLGLTNATLAADSKTYVAAGNLQRITDSMLLLRTTSQDLELTRDAKTKVNGQLTKGALARVVYDRVQGQAHALEVTVGDAARAQIGGAAAKNK